MSVIFVIITVIITLFLASKLVAHTNKQTDKSEELYLEKVKREHQVCTDCEDINQFVKADVSCDVRDKISCAETTIIIIDTKIVELTRVYSQYNTNVEDYYDGRCEKKRKSNRHKKRNFKY